jgi:16S rRNA (cytosine967-C5)-methyltransferase
MRSVIIDVCAGRGTKTRQLAAIHPHARIIATDTDQARFNTLSEQFRGHPRVQVVEHGRLREFQEQADLIVLDVPCSNTGVLARRVEAKYRFGPASTSSLVDLQRQIIADSIPLLARAGRILYATCSIEAAENSAQADWTCKWHRMRIEAQQLTMPRGLPGEPATAYQDGGYFALLAR